LVEVKEIFCQTIIMVKIKFGIPEFTQSLIFQSEQSYQN